MVVDFNGGQEIAHVAICVTANLKKPPTVYNLLFHDSLMKRMIRVVSWLFLSCAFYYSVLTLIFSLIYPGIYLWQPTIFCHFILGTADLEQLRFLPITVLIISFPCWTMTPLTANFLAILQIVYKHKYFFEKYRLQGELKLHGSEEIKYDFFC